VLRQCWRRPGPQLSSEVSSRAQASEQVESLPITSLLKSAIASLCFSAASTALGTVSAEDMWRTEPPMHYARAAHAVVSDGKSLCFGGDGRWRRACPPLRAIRWQ
jgi:hypothetical protein